MCGQIIVRRSGGGGGGALVLFTGGGSLGQTLLKQNSAVKTYPNSADKHP